PERDIFICMPPGPFNKWIRAFVHDGWKLHHLADGNRYRLFNLNADPGETIDLVEREPERFEDLSERYAEFRADLREVPPRPAPPPPPSTDAGVAIPDAGMPGR